MAIDYTSKKVRELNKLKEELHLLKKSKKKFIPSTNLSPKPTVAEEQDITKNIPSRNTGACDTSVHTMMSRRFKESVEVRAEIEHKATLLAPVCNKGAYTVITSDEMAKTAGRKI